LKYNETLIDFYRFHTSQIYISLVDRLIEFFNQKFPEIYVRSHIFNDWGEYLDHLQKNFLASTGPDIFQVAGGRIFKKLFSQNRLYDLTPHIKGININKRVTFYPHVLKRYTIKNKIYALPLEQGWVFFWYNKEICTSLGLNAPTSFDELLANCKTLSARKVVPFSLGLSEPWTGAFYYIYLSGRIGGYKLFENCADRKQGYTFLNNSFRLAAEKLYLLLQIDSFPSGFDKMSYEDQRKIFYEEKAAMQLMGNRLLNYILKEQPYFLKKVDYFPFPVIDGGIEDERVIQGGSIASFAINNDTKHKEEVLELLKLLTGGEARTLLVDMTEDLPAGPDGYDCSDKSELWQKLRRHLASSSDVQLHHFKYLNYESASSYLKIIKSIFLNETQPEDIGRMLEDAISANDSTF
jgi:raffinose/stachyose/melibiose transport system substrate-binding protein